MKKRTFWKAAGDFLTGRGFYMAMVLCLAAMGVSGWYVWRSVSGAVSSAQVSAAAQVTVEDSTQTGAESAAVEAAETAEEPEETEEDSEPTVGEAVVETVTESDEIPAMTPIEPEETDEEVTADVMEEVSIPWTLPVEGEVAAAFSPETLVYNEAMGDWRTHEGVDLSCGIGDEVHAACAGTVLSVEEDALLGWCVRLDCGEGIIATYGNLAEDVAVTEGQSVAAGELLGAVGDTAAGEKSGIAWLHFAVEKDGEMVDPMGEMKEE